MDAFDSGSDAAIWVLSSQLIARPDACSDSIYHFT